MKVKPKRERPIKDVVAIRLNEDEKTTLQNARRELPGMKDSESYKAVLEAFVNEHIEKRRKGK